jgi:hypothetical protein
MADGAGPIARGVERAHQRPGIQSRVRVGRDQAAAGAHPAVDIAHPLLVLGDQPQRPGERVDQLAPALVQPVGELGRLVQVEPVQQRAGVAARDALRVVGRDRGAQLVEVAGEGGGVEQQAVVGRDDGVLAQRRAQHIHREVEQPARLDQVPLGPEQRHGAVPAQRLRPGRDDEGQQRDAVALGRRTGEGDLAGAQAGAPEQLDRDHWLLASQLIPG